jgi:hypothetical protein
MKKSLLVIIILAQFVIACSSDRDVNVPITPYIKYELSGGAGHYNYAPSVIEDKYGIRYCFLCENKDPFKIVDYIYLYKGIPTPDGYKWQPGTEIIAPPTNGWDNCHICDPDVREFTTTYNGQTYYWIMTYLGVDRWDCNHNQIGIAISKNIEGPYTRVDAINPIIEYSDTTKWGVGQSTTIVKDSTTILLFYHSTTQNGPYCYREIKLNNLNNIIVGEEKHIPYLSANTYPCFSKNNIYMVSEERSKNYSNLIPTWVGDECVVRYRPLEDGVIAKNKENWKVIGKITPKESGFPRNHNPGFLTDFKGYLKNKNELVVYFTPAMTGENWLWSYDLYSATFRIKD